MKYLFVSGLYPNENIDQLNKLSNGKIQNAPNVFQWGIVEGFFKNDVDFQVLSLPFLPAYPVNYKRLKTPSGEIKYEGRKIGEMLPYCNLIAYKTFSMERKLYKYIHKWARENIGEELAILTYTPYVPFVNAVRKIKKEFKNVRLFSIVTDLVDDMMSFANNRKFLKRIQTKIETKKTKELYKEIDGFILLSKHMEDKIPESRSKNIVVEGISANKNFEVSEKYKERTILYAGTLQEFSGVRDLVNAFMKTSNPNYRLIICGAGSLTPMIEEASTKDRRIIYKGMLPREQVLSIQKKSTVLINPRKPNGQITRYSFPSKTIEYLSSGTPMIGYKLEGIPEEYYKHYYTIDDIEESCLIRTIEEVMSLSQEELNKRALNAFNFIMENKTSEKQIKRIIDYIRSRMV